MSTFNFWNKKTNIYEKLQASGAPKFTSGDAENPTQYTDVPVIVSDESTKSFRQKVSTMVKNIRYFAKLLGTTDISGITDGTVTGAVDIIGQYLNISSTAISKLISVYEYDDLDLIPYNVLFIMPKTAPKNSPSFSANNFLIIQSTFGNNNFRSQYAFPFNESGIAVRSISNGVWGEWKYMYFQ